ncbi:ABC transporter permease [Testudinibacter aquarius]|uniref:ABC transporter permease n=1 Tax=Testudinibacter aquarius TaxID=1524974 RepID=A0A4R3YA93_9PAST|nr:ABC transporter permease [Testudinibacter aquarius]KAE9528332.1 sugar ABC transporter permease [Testudinibacter aquarius]TCV88830.1 monosaccharide ABC transporter membrane protein (CUT2 family) [Testudinibacter aquarius]TNG86423.1 ABC transporter permease [Testudinibacter aquarius]
MEKVRSFSIKYGLIILLFIMLILFTAIEPMFMSTLNMMIILQSVSIVAILALGITATLAINGFDLSVGSTAAFSMMASSYVMVVLDAGATTAMIVSISIGIIVGLINAFLIIKMKIPDLLTTLGMMFLLLGLQLIPTQGRSISTGMSLADGTSADGVFSELFLFLGRARIFDLIPVPVVIMLFLAVITYLFLEKTRHGRMMYAIGSNEQAARLAGAKVHFYRYVAYVLSGVYASISGILLAARIGRGDVSSGSSLLMDGVAGALIGYAVLGAARPNALGAAVGALFVGVLLNGLTMMNTPYYTQDFIKGAVLVLALMFTFGLSKKVNN